MQNSCNLAPVVEGLEPRLLLSGSGVDAAVLSAVDAQWLTGGAPAVVAPQFSHDYGWADAWQHSGGNQGAALPPAGTGTVQSPMTSTPTPGARIVSQVVKAGSSQQLIVAGTNGNDTITISQTGSGLSVATQQGTSSFVGAFNAVTIYGFSGSDTIKVTYSTTVSTTVYTGDGTDTVYDLGRGSDTIYGGSGNDTLISFGGGSAHRVYGGSGMTSFWVDGHTTVNATPAEYAAGDVHQVNQFYGSVSMNINGQKLADPTASWGYSNFSSQPLFSGTPSYTDIRQGAVGDCYFVASLAAVANTNPNAISQMITSLGDGTYAVRFYRNGTPVYLRVDGDLPASGGSLTYAREGNGGDIWVALTEKAYAFYRTGANSYASLNSGWMSTVLTQVTNRGTQTDWSGISDQQMYNFINSALGGGKAVTAASYNSNAGPIIGNHAYMVKSVSTASNGTEYVTVYNPWGYDGVSYDSNSGDGLITLTITQFQQYFMAAVAIA